MCQGGHVVRSVRQTPQASRSSLDISTREGERGRDSSERQVRTEPSGVGGDRGPHGTPGETLWAGGGKCCRLTAASHSLEPSVESRSGGREGVLWGNQEPEAGGNRIWVHTGGETGRDTGDGSEELGSE